MMKQSQQFYGKILLLFFLITAGLFAFTLAPARITGEEDDDGDWLEGELSVKGVFLRQQFDSERNITGKEITEYAYSASLKLQVYHNKLDFFRKDPAKIRNYGATTMTQVVAGSNRVPRKEPGLSGSGNSSPMNLSMSSNSWRRNWENKLIHVQQSSGAGLLDYGHVGVNISFVPAPAGYAYRITARTGWGVAPFTRKDVPRAVIKTWDEMEKRWREETVKSGLIPPDYHPLNEVNFEYQAEPEEKLTFATIPNPKVLEDFLKKPETSITLPIHAGYQMKKDYEESNLQITGSLMLRGKRQPVEAMMTPPEGFEKWVPQAGADESTPGNGFPVTVKIHVKDKPDEEPVQTAKFKFELISTSKEKGICNNYPVNGTTGDYDLKISKDANPELTVSEDGQSAESKEELRYSGVYISAYDWGAYSKLKITAILDDGQEVVAYVEGNKEQLQLKIPWDENENYVADAWEKEKGIFGQNYGPEWDDDSQPAGQRRNGDGYTLYEEYRGFKTKAGFIRTTPVKKDLFVYDPDGLVKQYYEPHNPAKLELHYIDPTMMKFSGEARNPENRWVNCNSIKYRYARQYAMFVKRWTTMEGGTAGEANWITGTDELNDIDPYKGFEQPLKSIYIIKISQPVIERSLMGIKDPDLRQRTFQLLMTSTVIHEIGHGLGIKHHSEGKTETDQSVIVGVFDCAMRYNTPEEYAHPELLKPQMRFCGKGEKWRRPAERRDKNGNTEYYFEEVNSHNCFGQMDVKSDP
jgi:hypothetical protein